MASSVAMSAHLDLRIEQRLAQKSLPLGRRIIGQVGFTGREDPERDKHRGDEKNNRHGNPHQCRRAFLICKRSKSKHSGRRKI